ncbi:metallophosphoesterase family protein [Haloechinothrix sp. YIM 98757]|uniref:Metallophosphoesterase family protein n=1 Tax=Haloechinothrix aidingensis TaxID=2752311 RepID=A0A838ABE4_9PSEU|nr:metallophosphoesterase family protein [Haloechinothrix aidingensis]MBA0126546.1 metallophosphoesterase family protein [Haloechinothrix aidingensis]
MTVHVDRRSFLRGATLLGGAAATGPLLWQRPGYATQAPGGIHLTYGTDPRREMAVSWHTPESVSRPRLLLGDSTGELGEIVPADSTSAPGVRAVQHHVRLSGLDPDETYYYRAAHDGARSEELTFRTAWNGHGGNGRTVRFTAFGDQGTYDNRMAPVLRTIAGFDPDLHLHVGDLSYASDTGGIRAFETLWADDPGRYAPAEWDAWLSGVQPVSSRIPWMPVLGNHEMEVDGTELGYASYFARFSLPANGAPGLPGASWSLQVGNVAVVALDANDASAELPRNRDYLGGAQEDWLAATLADYRDSDSVDWIVVGFHHCAYCSSFRHGSDAGVRDRWSPLFDRYRVDLVVNGHNHLYERTHPIRGGDVTADARRGATVDPEADGTTYIVSGLSEEDERIPDRATEPGSALTHYTGTDFGLRVPETAFWSAVTDELSPVVICGEATARDTDGRTSLRLRSVDAGSGRLVDSVTLVRRAW